MKQASKKVSKNTMKITGASYIPEKKYLERYADVLVNYALNSGKGVKKGEVVQVIVPDVAKALLVEIQKKLLIAGAHPQLRMVPTGIDKDFFDLASPAQLKFFPKEYLRARADLIDHQIGVIADVDPRELQKVDPKKIIMARDSKKEFRDWLTDKEAQNKFTWTIALWGVQSKAEEVGLTLEEYWQEIIKACFLDSADPVAKWKEVQRRQQHIVKALGDMEIEWVHIEGEDADLRVKIGPERAWKGGGGRNIPSFEIFTSPDWRGTEGWIKFNEPLYRYGNVLTDIRLEFKDGVVVKATAAKGQKLLTEMLKSPNADKLGEFSMTDGSMSRITHVMAETLFDENIGGPFGNTHLAIGMAFKDCYRGDPATLTKEEWEAKGFNDSAEHTDIISTTDRTVTATLSDGSKLVIYQDGMFTL